MLAPNVSISWFKKCLQIFGMQPGSLRREQFLIGLLVHILIDISLIHC